MARDQDPRQKFTATHVYVSSCTYIHAHSSVKGTHTHVEVGEGCVFFTKHCITIPLRFDPGSHTGQELTTQASCPGVLGIPLFLSHQHWDFKHLSLHPDSFQVGSED